MNASHDYQRVYVWQLPVRFFPGINAAAITALCVTGWLITHPPALMHSGEAWTSFWFGKVRFVHFASGYVLLANFLVRLYWAFAGNKYASWRNFLPLTRAQFREVWKVLKPGAVFGGFEWVMTDKYKPGDAHHEAVKHDIMLGDGLAYISGTQEVVDALKTAGFEVEEIRDLAPTSRVPWYAPFVPSYTSLTGFRTTPLALEFRVSIDF